MGDDWPAYYAYLEVGTSVFAEDVYTDEVPSHLRTGYDENVGSIDEVSNIQATQATSANGQCRRYLIRT